MNVFCVREKINAYKRNWEEHLEIMDDVRISKQAWCYTPVEKGNRGKPTEHWSNRNRSMT